MRILATDGIDAGGKKLLEDMGFEVLTDFYEVEELNEKVKEADCIIVRSATKLRKPTIDAAVDAGRLKLAIRAGVGIDNIDYVYAESKGIAVRNTPNASSSAVAELALAHMFAISRFIATSNIEMRAGQWNKKDYKGVELAGKSLGLIGYGRIARSLADKARALGMKVYYCDILKIECAVDECCTFEEAISKADYISLHIPASKDGKAVIGAEEIAKMKKGVRIINCARGGIVDEAALLAALNSGHVAGAGIDVFEDEPTKNTELVNHPNVSVTPHIGAQTKEAQARIGLEVVEVVKNFFNK